MERRLAAILAADVVGYSRLVRRDEEGTVTALKSLLSRIIAPTIAARNGRIVKLMGDGVLVEFSSAVDAVRSAIEMQRAVTIDGINAPAEQRIELRVGINLGDVIIDGDDIHGDGVNIAARLESLADPAGIYISGKVYDEIRDRIDAPFDDAGSRELKNIDRPVHVWRWRHDDTMPAGKASTATDMPSLHDRPSVAILPFDCMSSDPETQFLADGFCEDLTTALSKIDTLVVASRTAAFAFKNTAVSAVEAGRELGVNYIIEGSVRTAGSRARINAQLIDQGSGNHIWAEKYDGSLDDVFGFQDAISEKIVIALEVHLSDGEQVLKWRKEANDPRAYEQFLSARAAYKEYSRGGNARARRGYEMALEIAPAFVSAMVGLARTHIEAAFFGWSEDRDASERTAKCLLDAAFELDREHALAQAELAHLYMVQRRFDDAVREAKRSVAIDPNLADAHHVLATNLVCLGQHMEAIRHVRESLKLNPGAPEFYLMAMAEAYVGLHRFDEALQVLQRVDARRPDWLMGQSLLAICNMGLGRREDAKSVVQNILRLNGRFTTSRWRTILYYPERADVPDLAAMLVAAGLPE